MTDKRDPFAPLPIDETLLPAEQVKVPESVADAPFVTVEPDPEPPLEPLPASFLEEPEATPTTKAKAKKAKKQRDHDDGDDERRGSRTGAFVAAIVILGGAGIAAMVLLGRVNSAKYVMVCNADTVSIERGRSFPPWGTSRLDGAEWQPAKIPPAASCVPHETESKAELAGWFGKVLEDQATALLTARDVSAVDEAEANLKQAMIVTRSLATEDAQRDTRGRIERLLGDVAYWRASARLRAAAEALTDAAKQFDEAALQKPRYVTDAAAWGDYVRKMVADLKLGPAGVKTGAFPPLSPAAQPAAAPVGTELPVEPDSVAAPAEPAAPAVDAGPAPTGGVLL